MTTLADKSLLSGGDNKPPMLEKHLYDSWKSRMELYMLNRPHGRMILASVEKGPLVWPSITEDGVTRLKEYIELTPAEAIQADCDIKAINIILQGLPTEIIYALVIQHSCCKSIFGEKIFILLMQGTRLFVTISKGEGLIASSVLSQMQERDRKPWFNDKVLMVQGFQQRGQVLTEDEISFLQIKLPDTQKPLRLSLHLHCCLSSEDLDAYDLIVMKRKLSQD
ncbi:hypothetical protein Tco_0317688 [Tanacetum coccineum]